MGLTCGHALARWRRAGVPVPLAAIHEHWRFEVTVQEEEQVASIPAVLDLVRVVRRQSTVQASVTRYDNSLHLHNYMQVNSLF